MPIAINGSGTVTGISVGGLPDGIVDTDMIAANAVTAAKRGAGAILQVKHTTKTDSFSSGTSSFHDITNFSVDITPISSSSKVFVMACVQYSTAGSGGSRQAVRLVRDSTALGLGDSAGNRVRCSISSETSGGGGNMKSATINFLDSPNTTSAVTYKIQCAAIDGNNFQLNASVADTNLSSYPRVASHMTVMEVAA